MLYIALFVFYIDRVPAIPAKKYQSNLDGPLVINNLEGPLFIANGGRMENEFKDKSRIQRIHPSFKK